MRRVADGVSRQQVVQHRSQLREPDHLLERLPGKLPRKWRPIGELVHDINLPLARSPFG